MKLGQSYELAKKEETPENDQGGLDYASREEQSRAKRADLLTLPPKVRGTNCSNCRFQRDGFCKHPEVRLPVTERMCCKLWDAEGSDRSWE